ncbi:hypothetical protein OPQ81_001562 [Rhizoctonia solani]|nr:hypothetical protein OPQ81_001562 [Rhizoctonia solani]
MEGRDLHLSKTAISLKNPPCKNRTGDVDFLTRAKHGAFRSTFPLELFEPIADHLFALTPQKDYVGSIHSIKPRFATVHGFMAASRALHDIGMLRWVRSLTIRDAEDWAIALRRPNLVRELICLDGVFGSSNQAILHQFPHLNSVSIDAHSDVHKNASGRFSYRDVFSSLPASVSRLEITYAHGPDLKIIETVRDCCPKIEALRLGRCTMFNRAAACEFWVGYPFDHDAYIASDGTDDYAHSVAQEMTFLTQLKHLRLGVYLVPSTVVLAHRAYHIRKEVAPALINWQQALSDAQGHHGGNGLPDASQLIEFYYRPSVAESEFGPESCSFCRDAYYDQSKKSRA